MIFSFTFIAKEANIPSIESWKIESENEADDYLKDLLDKPEYRRLDEVLVRAEKYVPDARIREYFIGRGKEMLKTYGIAA